MRIGVGITEDPGTNNEARQELTTEVDLRNSIMKIVRRFVKDESGATLPLAMMMIVIIGVMGAGLLTFASRRSEFRDRGKPGAKSLRTGRRRGCGRQETLTHCGDCSTQSVCTITTTTPPTTRHPVVGILPGEGRYDPERPQGERHDTK